MRITVLLENTSACGWPTEHGLSLLAETENLRFLFDMGQTDLFSRNARALGVDLNSVDFAVLSHGHYDHGGGLRTFLEENDHAPVYMSRNAFEPHFNDADRYIGIDPALQDSDRIVFVDEEKQIAPGFTLLSRPDAVRLVDVGSGGLTVRRGNRVLPDDFRHEQYLQVEENGKRILFSGCSHRGILNIMHWFCPDVLIGGFHLFRFPLDEMLSSCAEALNAYPTVYYTCHCTGTEQYQFMRERMPRLHYISEGDSIVV